MKAENSDLSKRTGKRNKMIMMKMTTATKIRKNILAKFWFKKGMKKCLNIQKYSEKMHSKKDSENDEDSDQESMKMLPNT